MRASFSSSHAPSHDRYSCEAAGHGSPLPIQPQFLLTACHHPYPRTEGHALPRDELAHAVRRMRGVPMLIRHPLDGVERIRNHRELMQEERKGWSLARSDARRLSRREVHEYARRRLGYQISESWDAELHSALGLPWPCPSTRQFTAAWEDLARRLERSGVALGTGHDADPALARAAFCLARHLRPDRVIETGVARGITSALIVHALDLNQRGHLWSIDLPPLAQPWRAAEMRGSLLADHRRWTFLPGSSRRCLPPLLRRHRTIDMFLHDSLHTRRNMIFELESAWHALRPGGVIIADDVHYNDAFMTILQALPHGPCIVAPHEAKTGLFGIVVGAR